MKKVFCFLFIISVMTISLFSLSVGATSESGILYGDANCDNNFNICDLIRLKKYLSDRENISINVPAVDENQDGKIEGTADLVIMRKTLLGVTTYDEHFAENGYFSFSW